MFDRGHEKAGVGGSIPSLATTFSASYEPSTQRLRSKTLQTRGSVGLLTTQDVQFSRPIFGRTFHVPVLTERAKSDVTLQANQPKPLQDFLSINLFRDEMMAALSAYGVP